jgi:protein PsiE
LRAGGPRQLKDRAAIYRRSKALMEKAFHHVENGFLLVIAVFTVIGMGQEVYGVALELKVELKDLILMFIYVEVINMVGAYYNSKKIPISLPIFIAITAIARLTILQAKEQPPVNLLFESGAILVLAIASAIINYKWTKKDDSP